MFTQDVIAEIARAANESAIEPAALLAIAEIESGGVPFADVDGRTEPLIRFEGHYFDRRLSPENRARARALGLSSPDAGAVANPPSQSERWRLLRRAAEIDAGAAYESTSWGLGQVIGAHWSPLGYANVDALVREARSGAAGQARLMAKYIIMAGLAPALESNDWPAFARGYNGPGFRANRYDEKLAAAYARFSGRPNAYMPPADGIPLIRRGDRGEAVRDLQTALSAAGFPVGIDGAFGPATEQAVRRFQQLRNLPADGIADPMTLRALRDSLSLTKRVRGWWAGIWSWFFRGQRRS